MDPTPTPLGRDRETARKGYRNGAPEQEKYQNEGANKTEAMPKTRVAHKMYHKICVSRHVSTH